MFRGFPPSLTVLVFVGLAVVYYLALTTIPKLKERELNRLKVSLMLAAASVGVIALIFLGIAELG